MTGLGVVYGTGIAMNKHYQFFMIRAYPTDPDDGVAVKRGSYD